MFITPKRTAPPLSRKICKLTHIHTRKCRQSKSKYPNHNASIRARHQHQQFAAHARIQNFSVNFLSLLARVCVSDLFHDPRDVCARLTKKVTAGQRGATGPSHRKHSNNTQRQLHPKTAHTAASAPHADLLCHEDKIRDRGANSGLQKLLTAGHLR